MSYSFTLPITCLDPPFMAIRGPTMEISSEIINYRTLKLTSEKKKWGQNILLGMETQYIVGFYMRSLWEHIR